MRTTACATLACLASLAPPTLADAVHLVTPAVAFSVHDEPVDNVGDSFNSFVGLIGLQPTRADRACQEYDVTGFAGQTPTMAQFTGTVSVNNAADNGVRTFDFLVYDANGVADLSDYQVAAVVVGTGSYHPPIDASFNYSIDATAAVAALMANGATHIGLRVEGTSNPNFPNILDDVNAALSLKFGSITTASTYCFGDGSGTPCPCANGGSASSGCANSVNAAGAALAGTGSFSLSAANSVLSGSGLVPNQPGLYFQGDNQVNGGAGTQFGDGLRCAGGNVVRLQVRVADASGNSATSVDIGAAGGVSAGQTKRYQLWYRDLSGSPCGSAFNLTNGVEATWAP
ncbi:MAG: hypothetical protein H6828_05465 [Planctomycetes bacterium]|nr:hypothetical protein [Planctomycetota bacterium]